MWPPVAMLGAPRGHVRAPRVQRHTIAPNCTEHGTNTVQESPMTIVTPQGHVWNPGSTLGTPKLATNTAQGSSHNGAMHALPPRCHVSAPQGLHAQCCSNPYQTWHKHCSGVCHDNSHTRSYVWSQGATLGPPGAMLWKPGALTWPLGSIHGPMV